jgi:hypothetical protein
MRGSSIARRKLIRPRSVAAKAVSGTMMLKFNQAEPMAAAKTRQKHWENTFNQS